MNPFLSSLKTDQLIPNLSIVTEEQTTNFNMNYKQMILMNQSKDEFSYTDFCKKFKLEDNKQTLKLWKQMFQHIDDFDDEDDNIAYIDLLIDDCDDKAIEFMIDEMFERDNDTASTKAKRKLNNPTH
jgi:hypothetical protein